MNKNNTHECKLPDNAQNGNYGHAISYCIEEQNDIMLAGNDEYESQVNFCPICGQEAKIKIKGN